MLGTPPKSGLKVLRKGLEAKSGLKGLEAPGGPWRPLEAPAPEAPGGAWRQRSKDVCGAGAPHTFDGLWRFLEAPAPPAWRPLQTCLRRARLSLGRSKTTIFSRWELRA